MKLIVGLGNPGRIYIDTRHNIGFRVIKTLARVYRIVFRRESSGLVLSGRGKIQGQEVVLAMPLTFMNLSGVSVRALFKKYKAKDLLVICDDLDLEFGRLKIKSAGSSGGHQGLKSIIDSIGSKKFSRLRIGIGRPLKNIKPADYVLSPFNKKEKTQLPEIIERAIDCCRVWAGEGMTKCMNIFNRTNR